VFRHLTRIPTTGRSVSCMFCGRAGDELGVVDCGHGRIHSEAQGAILAERYICGSCAKQICGLFDLIPRADFEQLSARCEEFEKRAEDAMRNARELSNELLPLRENHHDTLLELESERQMVERLTGQLEELQSDERDRRERRAVAVESFQAAATQREGATR
jgi:hypothetical protein